MPNSLEHAPAGGPVPSTWRSPCVRARRAGSPLRGAARASSSASRAGASISFGGRSATPCEVIVRRRSTGSPPAPLNSSSADHGFAIESPNALREEAFPANMCSCRARPRSCTRISTPSSRRSSSATTRACAGGPVIVGSWVVLAASYEAKARGVRTAMSVAPGPPAVPGGDRGRAADGGVLGGEQGGLPRLRGHDAAGRRALDRRGVSRRPRCAPADRARPPVVAALLRREVRERVGLPITVGVARTKFLAKVASGVAKPDGLLVVPPERELAFLHPLEVERLWGVGPVTARRLHGVGITTVGQVAELGEDVLVSLLGRAAGRQLYALARNRDPRQVRPAAVAGRSARSARWAARRPRSTRWTRRSPGSSTGWPGGCAPPAGPAGRSCCGSASTTSRGRRARTRCRTRPRARGRSSKPPAACSRSPRR